MTYSGMRRKAALFSSADMLMSSFPTRVENKQATPLHRKHDAIEPRCDTSPKWVIFVLNVIKLLHFYG